MFPGSGSRNAFTLLELLVVMLIISILAGLGTAGYQLARRTAKEGQAKAEIELLRSALEEFRVEYGAYPEEADGTFEGVFGQLPDAQVKFLEQAMAADLVLIDPWGNPYYYALSNRFQYVIWSEGVDSETVADNIDPSGVGY